MKKSSEARSKSTKATKEEKPSFITKEATEDIEVSVFPPQSEKSTYTGASLKIETAAGQIYVKGLARWSQKNEKWYFSGPSHKDKDGEYIQDVFGSKEVFESINNAINAAIEEA